MTGRARILVVEDSPKFSTQLQRILETAGYEVRTALTLDEAVRALDAEPFNLVTVDLELDEGNEIREGEQLLLYLDKKHPHIPRIVISAEVQDKEDAVAMITELKATDFLDKANVTVNRILSKVQKALEHGAINNPRPSSKNNLIFISYRRSSSQQFAMRVYEHLLTHNVGEVFIDYEKLGAGSFPNALRKNIERCDVFLSIISKGTFDRIHEENDWVREEIELGLRYDCVVIPVVDEDSTVIPDRATLPAEIQPLLDNNTVFFHADVFKACVENLVRIINNYREERSSDSE